MSTNKAGNNASIMPYLFFSGKCDEALAFYKSALGATVHDVMRFKDSPDPLPAGAVKPGFENKVMHSSFTIRGTTMMASDGCADDPGHKGFSLSLSVKDSADANKVFAALSEGGKVQMPLAKTFFSPQFGMVQDRFGISWMIIVLPE